eukprot:TRINITY_DN1852_c0_g1_i7.p1 TRINITY_DN1852_c0_g1~~TRINITY_DN1852_c0_g1_i7.p1  ORF type:complete len:230 (+),score=-2.06 TRINITY_DN1852_c0_g1_i7:399-1088(+)
MHIFKNVQIYNTYFMYFDIYKKYVSKYIKYILYNKLYFAIMALWQISPDKWLYGKLVLTNGQNGNQLVMNRNFQDLRVNKKQKIKKQIMLLCRYQVLRSPGKVAIILQLIMKSPYKKRSKLYIINVNKIKVGINLFGQNNICVIQNLIFIPKLQYHQNKQSINQKQIINKQIISYYVTYNFCWKGEPPKYNFCSKRFQIDCFRRSCGFQISLEMEIILLGMRYANPTRR